MPTLDKDILPLLSAGQFEPAIAMLEDLTRMAPPDGDVYFNLGLARSETGQYPEAVIALKRALELHPRRHEAWIALGVAYGRLNRCRDAKEALQQALHLKPGDGLALQNLAAMLMMLGEKEEAASTARLAVASQPPNPQALWALAETVYALAQATSDGDKRDGLLVEATDAYRTFLKRYPESPMAEAAEQQLTKMAGEALRRKTTSGFRPDVFEYIVGALKLFDAIGPDARNRLVSEVAEIGSGGLDINNPEPRFNPATLKGRIPEGRDFSALHLVSILYAGMQQIRPGIEVGVDFGKEYRAALRHLGRE